MFKRVYVAYTAVCYSRFAAARQLLASGPAECRQRPSILEVRYYCLAVVYSTSLEERFYIR